MAAKARAKFEPRHIRLYHTITGSEAWRALSGNSMKVLIALVRIDNGSRNGELGFSHRHAAELTGLSPNTCLRCLGELQEKGFIRCTVKGAFSLKIQHASQWRFTWAAASWPGGNVRPTRDFEQWRPNEEKSRPQFPNEADADFGLETETVARSDANSGAGETETPLVSAIRSNPGIGALILYQGEATRNGEQRHQEWKHRSSQLSDLRASLTEWLANSEAGEQGRLSRLLGIPGGTLSKFRNGGNLPSNHTVSLADFLARRQNQTDAEASAELAKLAQSA